MMPDQIEQVRNAVNGGGSLRHKLNVIVEILAGKRDDPAPAAPELTVEKKAEEPNSEGDSE
jgi:hypothetical protein